LWPLRGAGKVNQKVVGGRVAYAFNLFPVPEQKCVTHDFGLLFDPVAIKLPPWMKCIAISTEHVTPQRQVPSAVDLSLPHMRHLVDEQALVTDGSEVEILVVPR
jgi:hypothetical protein